MGNVRSDDEDDIRSSAATSRRFKFPKKSLDDCNGVHVTSVPRKIRSANKKRCCRSISLNLPASKKLNWQTDGVEFHRKNGSMKSSLILKQDKAVNFPKDDDISLPLSKDEEEVAQALFALASVIPNSSQTCNDDLDGEHSGDKYSDLPKTANFGSSIEEAVVLKAEAEPKAPHQNNDENIPPVVEGPASDVITLPFVNDTRQPDISTNKKFLIESGVDVPKFNLHSAAITSERISCGLDVSNTVADIKFQPGSKLQAHEGNLTTFYYPETAREHPGAASGMCEAQSFVMENRNTGKYSRLCFSGEGLHSAKLPARSHKASSHGEHVSGSGPKDDQAVLHSNKSWKRCLTHAYISRYIRGSQAAGKINRLPLHSSQNNSKESNSGSPDNRLPGLRNSLLGVGSSNDSASPSPEKNSEEVRNAVLLHKRLVRYQQQACTTPYSGKKQQCIDRFSLPIGYGVEASNDTNGAGQSRGTSSHLFPFLQSQGPVIPIPLFQNYYTSTSSSTQASVAAAQQVQMPTYVGSTSYGPQQMGLIPLPIPAPQMQQKKEPVHQSPYKSGVNLPYIPVNWQGGVVDISALLHQTQNPFHPSCSSVEVYAPIFLR